MIVDSRGVHDYLTVLKVSHSPRLDGSQVGPTADVVAKWTTPIEDSAAAARKQLAYGLGALMVLIAAVFIAMWSLEVRGPFGSLADTAPQIVLTNPEAAAPKAGTAVVTAGRLNCRALPEPAARSVEVLSQGQDVEVVAKQPGWTGIALRAQQCWVRDRYLSREVAPQR
jgi:hypothetical protein